MQPFSLMPDSCKWLQDDAEWFYTPWSMMPSDELVKIEVVESRVVDDQVCSVLGVLANGALVEESKLVVFYDEESGLVHFYEDGNWKLLFDFSENWKVGDTLSYFLPQNFEYFDISSTSGEFETSTNAIKLLNAGEEWISIDGEDVRVIHTQAIPENEEDCFIMESIISGIGSKKGFLGRNCTQLAAGFSEYFRCFKGEDVSYSEVEDCIPPQRIWFGEEDSEWHHCLLVELGDPYTVDIHTRVIDTYESEGKPVSTIKGAFFGHTYNPENDEVDIINSEDKVYYSFGEEMHLLYDFGAEVGDTLTLRFPIEFEPQWFEDSPETSIYFKIVIDSISFETIEFISLRRIHFKTIIETNENFNHIWAPTYLGDFYTEKLGYEHFTFPFIVTGYDENNVTCSLKEYAEQDLFYENEDAYCLTVSTHDVQTSQDLTIAPNPAYHTISIDLNESIPFEGWIANVCGQKISVFNAIDVDVSSLNNGLYFINLRTQDGNRYAAKFIKH